MVALAHFVGWLSRHRCRGAKGGGGEPVVCLAHQGVRIGLEEGERFLGPSLVRFGISGFRNVCCSMASVLPGRSRKWRRIRPESVALRGTSLFGRLGWFRPLASAASEWGAA